MVVFSPCDPVTPDCEWQLHIFFHRGWSDEFCNVSAADWLFVFFFNCYFYGEGLSLNTVGMSRSSDTNLAAVLQKSLFENEQTISFCARTGNGWGWGEWSLVSHTDDSAH